MPDDGRSANDFIVDEVVSHALDLLRLEAGERRQVLAILRDLEKEIVAILTRIDPTGVSERYRPARLAKLLEQVRGTIRASYRDASQTLARELIELADIEAQFITRAINNGVGFGLATNNLTREQLRSLARGVLVQGAPVSEWWSDQAGQTLQRFTREMRMGIASGETNAQLIRRIRGGREAGEQVKGFMSITRSHAESLVRSATQAVAADAKQQVYEANADILKGVMWVATLDARTTVGCFPSSTLALPVGDLRGVFRRSYEGDLVVITTASGKQLRCTPNHPVLTARGWRPADELKPSADVLHRIVGDVGSFVSGENVTVPTSIGAISDALFKIPGADVSVERSTKADFHGDGQIGDYEIYRPRAECDLRAELVSSGSEDVEKSLLVGVHLGALFPALGRFDLAAIRDWLRLKTTKIKAAPLRNGIEGAFGYSEAPDDLGGLNPVHKGLGNGGFISALGLLAAPKGGHNASALENASDGCGGDAKGAANLSGGDAVSVVADNIVSVERELFSGHVFNLHTSHNFYIADGFLVHNCATRDGLLYDAVTHEPIDHDLPWGGGPGNLHWGCRSTSVPVTKSWRELGLDIDDLPAGTRASMDGQVPADTRFETWLEGQSKARQDEVLGAGRADLWREGNITFRDMLDQRGRELTLDELRARI